MIGVELEPEVGDHNLLLADHFCSAQGLLRDDEVLEDAKIRLPRPRRAQPLALGGIKQYFLQTDDQLFSGNIIPILWMDTFATIKRWDMRLGGKTNSRLIQDKYFGFVGQR